MQQGQLPASSSYRDLEHVVPAVVAQDAEVQVARLDRRRSRCVDDLDRHQRVHQFLAEYVAGTDHPDHTTSDSVVRPGRPRLSADGGRRAMADPGHECNTGTKTRGEALCRAVLAATM